ncbi:SART-1 family protein DOT2 [Pyrus communis]|uniref:SART-1 family protein DOT2 n=1 Tax=Pyrus communis TaxID=23211 RepID=UPI0035BF3360
MDPESEDVSNMQEDDHAEETTVNVAGGWTEVNDGIEREDKEHIIPPAEDHKEEKGVSDGIFREVAVGKGLSGPLKLLKERGSLEVKHDTDAVQMTYELGRPMTQKEAYNRLSHAFHRKGPGKRTQEKRMKQFEKEQKLKQMNSSDTPLQSMERVRDAQAQLRKPYLVLRGHV